VLVMSWALFGKGKMKGGLFCQARHCFESES
jgi:hypothetical protein